ncbi:hypothetical protein AVEN_17606-1 [Araneus ventricosus]|uniref:Uncharacterized protein n=1 Tax=Araneus ventricosus TaxID=182803 RepID=A0A4Y2L8R4_ARAVE|nr:hypothetical protein AVEN_17606-1 [Araneus ventricosus]
MFGKSILWNASVNLLNLCLVMWQPLSRPEEAQLSINLLSLIQWHFSVFAYSFARAVCIELASSLSTESFLAVLRRLIARRCHSSKQKYSSEN